MTAEQVLTMMQNVLQDITIENLREETLDDCISTPLYRAFAENKFPSHSIECGSTKAVILVQGESFVLKIPFGEYYSEDSFDDRVANIAAENNFARNEAYEWVCENCDDEEFCYEFEMAHNNRLSHDIMQKYECLLTGADYCALESCYYEEALRRNLGDYFAAEEFVGYLQNFPVYKQQRVVPFYEHHDLSIRKRKYEERQKSTRARCEELHCWCFDEIWIADFFDIYGENEFIRLTDFLEEFEIGDIRRANIGYLDGLPILLDYAGYNEW